MVRAYYDEENFRTVIPSVTEIRDAAYNMGWHQGYDPNYMSDGSINVGADRLVYANWKLGLKEGEKARQYKHLSR